MSTHDLVRLSPDPESASPVSDIDGLRKLDSQNALEPGQYWRLTKTIEVPHAFSRSYGNVTLHEGDVHLITKLFEFEGTLHSITFLEHPRNANSSGKFSSYTLLTNEFFAAFEPIALEEAKAIRATEQAQVMAEVQSVQDEMMQAQSNPLALPAVQEAARKAVEEFERNEAHRVQAEVKDTQQRAADLRRIHRRAARRSEAKGNPVAVRKATISDRLDVMISEGVTSDGVRDLQLEAGRRLAIAEATSKWLADRSRHMGEILKRVTPFFSEQGQLALASASGAIARVSQIERGITSLKLYTGDGIDVVPVREGADAPTSEPLTLMQRKLAMDEELAVWVDVDESFDFSNQSEFFKHLATDSRLLQQILPTPRCVVSMLTTRRHIEYGRDLSAYERMQRDIANKRVFLLIRNGENVHAVYSCEPSHEAAKRLFPTEAEIHEPFQGIDGSSIGLHDVAFGDATGDFDDLALHYRRFLILLCGLDHRMNLFGEFFPPEEKPAFMSLAFQQRYFRFIEDDDSSRMIGGDTESAHQWMTRHNANLRSGSRVVVTGPNALSAAVPHVRRSRDTEFDTSVSRNPLVAALRSGSLYLPVPTIKGAARSGTATAWLNGPDAHRHNGIYDWYLCIDRVKAPEIQRFIHNRSDRIGSIAWILTLRRAAAILELEAHEQAPLRAFLRKSALEARVHTEATVDEAIDQAVATWRADHRGAAAPALSDTTGMAQLLSLIFPADQLAYSMAPMVQALCERESLQPLLFTRTGKNQYVLYSVFPEEEREPYSTGVEWGWVRRNLLKVGRDKVTLGSQSTVWLMAESPSGTEECLTQWPELKAWLHEKPEPCKLSTLAKAKEAISQGQLVVEWIAHARDSGDGLYQPLLDGWLADVRRLAGGLSHTQTPYLWIPLGVYQRSKDSAPDFLYVETSMLDVLSYATDDQRSQCLSTSGLRSKRIASDLGQRASPAWRIRRCSELHTNMIELEGQVRKSDQPAWACVETHEPGGIKRSSRFRPVFHSGSTRSDRRKTGGDPRHTRISAKLSLGRAIDTLMGTAPHLRRAFYKSTEERVRRHWFHVGADDAEHSKLKALQENERTRRFEPPVPLSFDLAPCLWDPLRGRSLANRFFRAKK